MMMSTTTLNPGLATLRRENVIRATALLGLTLVVAVLVHSYNMFGYPLYLGDEGIYMSQAYAALKMGRITPYTYWYDHAPAGWLLIALWSAITGGFNSFGTAVDGGRVLMLLLHIFSVILLFRITEWITANVFAATAAGLLYALSPLTVIYGRMVLLDNIMVFWVLLATALFLLHKGKIWPLLFSALCFGMAVLTKEIAILFLPAFVYGLWTLVEKSHARFARAVWLYAALATISLYPLYAALRSELIALPLSSPLSGSGGPISLVGTALWQIRRTGGTPWDPSSEFFQFLATNWFVRDPWLLALGTAATVWNLLRGGHQRRLIALLSIGAILSIARGYPVLDFYIVTVLPFLALNLGLAIVDLASLVRLQTLLPVTIAAAVAVGWYNLDQQRDVFTLNLTTAQRQALDWVREHVPANAQIVTDDDLWVDLRDGGPDNPSFPGTHSHWKAANDPAVYRDLFYDDWRNLDYLILTPGLDQIFAQDPDKLTYLAYSHSTPIANFGIGDAIVEVRKVDSAGPAVEEMLVDSYNSFRSQYIQNGQVRAEQGHTDARDQAAAMLMAVWMDDQDTFEELWNWTRTHLQSEFGLLYHSNKPGADLYTSTDADTDTALALLLAEKRWNDVSYKRYARRIIQAIWEHEVVEIEGAPYLAAGNWAVSEDQIIFAPATFAPYAYHFFAEVDPEHNWWYLLDTNYKLLNQVTHSSLGEAGSVGLPPAYVGIDRETGALIPNPDGAAAQGNEFDDNAAQVYWRVGLDAQWHEDRRADRFLTASPFPRYEWKTEGKLAASYSHTGRPQTDDESLIMYSVLLPKFLIANPQVAHEVFATQLVTAFTYTENEGQWGDGKDPSQARWAWLATGLYANALQESWDTE
jgi:endo-1,4-beta-D-glucanase Y/4-amino-4-deoxy-L-arabinose transferase-like glycosyltransferase